MNVKRGLFLSCLCFWCCLSVCGQHPADSLWLQQAVGDRKWDVKGQLVCDRKKAEPLPTKRKQVTVNYGIKGGFTASLFLIPHFKVNGVSVDEVQNNYKIGYFGAAFMRINFGRHYLQPEISYNVNRCDITFNKPRPEGAPDNWMPEQASITSSLHSIDIPVIYGYNFIKNGPYSLGVFAGPKIRCLLTGQSEVSFNNFDQDNIHETLRRLNLSATLGVAVTISKVFFDFRYDIGLHNISKRIAYVIPADDGTLQTQEAGKGMHFHRRDNVLSFSLGMFF